MGKTSGTFFREAERLRIEETICAVENRTIGEIAVMLADSSEQYHDAEILASVFLGSLASLLLTLSFFHASLWFYIPFSILCFFPARLLVRSMPALKLSLAGVRRKEEAVRERAIRAFYEKGLHRTTANTGVLFFLSLLEHKVWVLADVGINEKIDQETLNAFARNVSQGIREGRACEALCEAITAAGDVLALHFPIAPHDRNELPDKIIMD